MTPIRLATIGIIAAGAMFGALTASAAPIGSLGTMARSDTSIVTPVGCWWSYGHYYCRHHHYYHRYHRRHYYYRY